MGRGAAKVKKKNSRFANRESLMCPVASCWPQYPVVLLRMSTHGQQDRKEPEVVPGNQNGLPVTRIARQALLRSD